MEFTRAGQQKRSDSSNKPCRTVDKDDWAMKGSLESMAFATGTGGAPYHGEIILAFDPNLFSGGKVVDNDQRAERLFADIVDQGARLPSQRRYAARARNLERGYVEIPQQLHEDILKLTIS